MMKKIYITPQMDVVTIMHNAQLLAGSIMQNGDSLIVNPGDEPSIGDGIINAPGLELPGLPFDDPLI